METTDSLGARVRRLRSQRHWTQERLAKEARVDQTAVSRIESREGYEPGVFIITRIAEALGVTVEQLIGRQPAGQTLEVPIEHGLVAVLRIRAVNTVANGVEPEQAMRRASERIESALLKGGLESTPVDDENPLPMLPDQTVESESRLPAGPIADAFHLLRMEIGAALQIAQEARATAEEAKQAVQRRRNKSA